MKPVFLLFCTLVLVSHVEAATLYVNNSGSPACSDATNKASNASGSPWCTIGRAAWGSTNRAAPNTSEAATAGDTVLITAGTYSTAGTNSRYEVAYNSANSGSAGNPITYRCATDLACTLTLSSSGGPVIGACGTGGGCGMGAVDYITWRGFVIDEANAPSRSDTGPVVFVSTTGSKLEYSHLDGNGNPGFGDNHTGVRIEGSSSITVSNNIIHDFTTSGVSAHNGAGVMVYESYNLTIEHNEIYQSGSGVFIKQQIAGGAVASSNYVRLNLVYGSGACVDGILMHRMASSAALYYITQNIVYGCEYSGIALRSFDATEGPYNVDIVNNTVDNASTGGAINLQGALIANENARVFNNILYGSNAGLYSQNVNITEASVVSRYESEHNVFYGNTNAVEISNAGHTGSATYTVATWKSGSSQDSVAPAAGSSDPLFVNATTHNYRLQGGSPYLSQGVDVLDLDGDSSTSDNIPAGSYITGTETIGVEPVDAPVTPGPRWSPSTNLRVAEVQP